MIEYLRKDITTIEKGIIVHGCNCQGVMASGVARAIRARWPSVYLAYLYYADGMDYTLGDIIPVKLKRDLWVINGLTQFNFGREASTRYGSPLAISQVLCKTVLMAIQHALPIYMPKIGCGLGGLNWEADVEPVVQRVLHEATRDVPLYVCVI